MTWQNELRESIKLTSPEGSVFEALWVGDERSFERKLGIFSPPSFRGDIVQDLGVKSWQYPLTFYFEGAFHNKEAERFATTAYNETGQWEVVHPTKGALILQLASLSEAILPIETGNYTAFTTQWIEPANQDRLISIEELSSSILRDIQTALEDAQVIFEQSRTGLYELVQSTINSVNASAGIFTNTIGVFAQTNAIAQDAFESAQVALTSALSNFDIENPDLSDVSAALIAMALCLSGSTDMFSTVYTIYSDAISGIIGQIPAEISEDDFNIVVGYEFAILLCLIALCQILVEVDFSTRVEIIAIIENLMTVLNTAITALDNAMLQFNDYAITEQYYSLSGQYTAIINLYTKAYNYLLVQFFNAKIEKRITLKKQRSPIEITVTEYGRENFESNYQLFLDSNELSGTDILLLPAGREVVIYEG